MVILVPLCPTTLLSLSRLRQRQEKDGVDKGGCDKHTSVLKDEMTSPMVVQSNPDIIPDKGKQKSINVENI